MVDQQKRRQSRREPPASFAGAVWGPGWDFPVLEGFEGDLSKRGSFRHWVALLKRAILDTEKEGKGGGDGMVQVNAEGD